MTVNFEQVQFEFMAVWDGSTEKYTTDEIIVLNNRRIRFLRERDVGCGELLDGNVERFNSMLCTF